MKVLLFITLTITLLFACVSTQDITDSLDNLMTNWISAFNNEDSNALSNYFWTDAKRIRNNANNTQDVFDGIIRIMEDTNSLFNNVDASLFNYVLVKKDLETDPKSPSYSYVVDLPKNKIEHSFYFKNIDNEWRIIKHVLDIEAFR
ncbi:unnamed protein product [marine sediment metagenome]|uniref:DUF4440 domain-containing protein n=1 Tax=marine sediment metagenome TaxID=412755 RepID=X0VYH1_9ZZZZ